MQTVLITGAACGIGREAARLFAASGWRCVLVDYNARALHPLGQSLPRPAASRHILRTMDLTDAQQIATMGEDLPALDALINNAGMSDTSNTPLAEQSATGLARLLALNLAAPAAVIDACSAALTPGARIVNVASGAGLLAIPWRGAYSPSKAGLIAQTRALARARPDWCVTALAPGFVRTELLDGLIQTGKLDPANAISKIPLGRMGLTTEMAHALYFLASAGARPLSGQIMAINGGSSVYGGAHRFPVSELAPLPLDMPTKLHVVGGDETSWRAFSAPADSALCYTATLDLSPLSAPSGHLVEAVHAAGVRFAAHHDRHASLTLLLPASTPGRWQAAGDAAAARMLVSTFACEWGARALRINALEVAPAVTPDSLHPLLRYLCGPASQYLTGQTLACIAT